ncbi:MAG: hypothetical protein GX774_21940 [Armatimonadetes bacterium]|nr:hypothetical protein [Armatimonadota bacterium]
MSVLELPAVGDAERVAALRQRCRERKWQGWPDDPVLTARSLRASEGIASWQIRKGLLTRDRLAGMPLALDDLELLLGRPAPRPAASAEEEAEARAYLARYPWPGGQNGHCELDRSRLFALGIDGLAGDLRARRDAATGARADTYQSFLYALEGLAALAENAARTAEAAITSAPEWRQAELRAMADSCRRIAHQPPASFRDAIQLLWLTDLGVMYGDSVGLVVPGHLDRTLWPYYEADRLAGRLTRDEALLLIESLYLLVNEYIPDGLAMSVMVGGRDAEGHDVTNELSFLCLEALRRTRLIYPTVGICWHPGTPEELTALAVELIGQGYSTPAFFGDETIQRGLKALGVPPAEACHYINSTCVEITPVGASNVWVASPYFPVCRYLLDEIAAQVESGQPAPDFDSFRERYQQRLAGHIAAAVAEQNELRRQRQAHGGKPLQSLFTRDCVARGRDIDDGGATYNWVECSFVGLANLADSLQVIRAEVYEQRRLTLADLKALLDRDFEGGELERLRFLRGHAKYGNGCADVDAFVGETVAFVRAECARHRMLPDDSPFVPGSFCWIMHEMLGRECGATPDGRRAGFPFADGCGPAQGREEGGPTAAILSTTSWDHSPMIGGAAYNMRFNASLFRSPGALNRLRDLVVTFLRRGGFETQINVVDHETLKRARANPDEYRDLIVRIGGYTDYFTRLSPQMQEEILMRTEFAKL